MTTTRRGFLSSLLAIPVVAKLLPQESPWPVTLHPIWLPMPPGAKYADMYRDRLWFCGRDYTAEPATFYFSQAWDDNWPESLKVVGHIKKGQRRRRR